MNKKDYDIENAFGFSLVSEEELKQHEEYLKKKVEEQSIIVQRTSNELTDKLHTLKNMIMPLLVNLAKDPDKSYIFWPNRVEKINEFIQKIDKFIES